MLRVEGKVDGVVPHQPVAKGRRIEHNRQGGQQQARQHIATISKGWSFSHSFFQSLEDWPDYGIVGDAICGLGSGI